ncbi:MAG: hypothetical protein IPH46_06765 [Bacteroidetes bacterium]|nr:hypothetical protein [Bacteroidota bacterium]
MKFDEIIKSISDDFTKAWNDWDVDKMKNYLTDYVIIYSPKIQLVYPDNVGCKLEGKDQVIEYWKLLKSKIENYKVVQLSVCKDNREVKTVNRVVGSDIIVYETFVVNEYGKIEYLKYEYE